MPTFIIYLIKANIALTLFYSAYRFGLRRLTFYTLNRFFLLFGIAFSAIFPLINPDTFFRRHEQLADAVTYYAPDWNSIQQIVHPQFTIWNIVQYVFWAGVAAMVVRLSLQLISLFSIHIKTMEGRLYNEKVRLMHNRINPFSFFKNIYINPSLHSPEELENILRHEKIHIKGWHTLDVLCGEINHIFYWFNPGAWLLKTAIRENLEFITDRKVLQSGADTKTYQYSLIHVGAFPYAVPVTNNFNFSHLKKRIIMMNKKKSRSYHLLRYLLLLPLISVAALVINSSRAESISTQNYNAGSISPSDSIPARPMIENTFPVSYNTFIKRNPSVKSMAWSRDSASYIPVAIIHLKNGKTERYHLNNREEMQKAQERYGRFPSPPPPPPPSPSPSAVPTGKPTSFNNSNDTIIRTDRYYAKLAYQKAREKEYNDAEMYADKSLKLNSHNSTASDVLRYVHQMKEYQTKMEEYKKQHGDSLFPKVKVHFVPPVVAKDSIVTLTTSPDEYYAQLAYQKAREKDYGDAEKNAAKSLKLNLDNGTAKAVLRYVQQMKEFQQKMEEYKKQRSDSDSSSAYDLPSNHERPLTSQAAYTLSSPYSHYEWTIGSDHTVNYTSVKPERYNISLTTKTNTNTTPADTYPPLPDNVLYIIDGRKESKEYLRTTLTPENIGSIDVLKDKSAIARYGPKAVNGAIVIKTKQYLKKHPEGPSKVIMKQ